jgi:RimJ/RimL family protein N-acetyltransferase
MIETARLRLIACELEHFEAILEDERRLASLLRVTPAEGWLGFPAAQEAMRPSYEYLKRHPSVAGWWTYLFVHKGDSKLIGLGGFKGAPNEGGVVEFGYALAPGYRGLGLASEAARAMIAYAFSHAEVRSVIAHTLPEKNASTRVLERVGLEHEGTVHDPDDGEVWRWSLTRAAYRAA